MSSDMKDVIMIKHNIEHKLVSGDDLIRLYKILVSAADEYNHNEIEKRKKENPGTEKYYNPYSPTYSIEISDTEKIDGSDIYNLQNFISERKTPIDSIWFDFSARNMGISIRTNSKKTYSNNYEIKGDPDWVSVTKGKLDSVIDNMHSLPSHIIFITKYDLITSVAFILIMYVIFAYIILKLNLKIDSSVSPWIGALYVIPMMFLYEKIFYYFKSKVEFKLNDNYIDKKSKTRKKISGFVGGLITAFTLFQFISVLLD